MIFWTLTTLGVLIFAGTNFREFREFRVFWPKFAKISTREIFLIWPIREN